MSNEGEDYQPKHSSIEEVLKEWKYYAEIARTPGMRIQGEWQLFNDLAQDINFFMNRDFNWPKTILHANSITDLKSRAVYLLERKAACDILNTSQGVDFVKNCQIEIDKLRSIIELNPGHSENNYQASNFMATFTNNQVVLIFHYFMKFINVSIGNQIDRSSVAKFIHLILNKEFTNVSNSDIYDRLGSAPNSTNDTTLIGDLKIIRPLFEKVQLDVIVKFIDDELSMARSEKKRNQPKK